MRANLGVEHRDTNRTDETTGSPFRSSGLISAVVIFGLVVLVYLAMVVRFWRSMPFAVPIGFFVMIFGGGFLPLRRAIRAHAEIQRHADHEDLRSVDSFANVRRTVTSAIDSGFFLLFVYQLFILICAWHALARH